MKTNTHFWSYLAQLFLKWEMFQPKVVQKIKTHILSPQLFSENLAVYEIMWKNIVERGRPQMAIWRMRIACWIPKAKNTHSQYVIFIAFPSQQWLHERAAMLRFKHILSCSYVLWLSTADALSCKTFSVAESVKQGRDVIWLNERGLLKKVLFLMWHVLLFHISFLCICIYFLLCFCSANK